MLLIDYQAQMLFVLAVSLPIFEAAVAKSRSC